MLRDVPVLLLVLLMLLLLLVVVLVWLLTVLLHPSMAHFTVQHRSDTLPPEEHIHTCQCKNLQPKWDMMLFICVSLQKSYARTIILEELLNEIKGDLLKKVQICLQYYMLKSMFLVKQMP